MTSSVLEASAALVGVEVTDDALAVELADGRTVSVPLGWYPRLEIATPEERSQWRAVGGGRGIHWPALDEDVSVENLLAGKPSTESHASFGRWLATRSSTSKN